MKWLSKDQLTKENVLDARADLVFAGWNYGFRDDSGFTPEALKKLGIPSYILTESCRNGRTKTSRGLMSPLDALYADLTNLGKLFGVEKRAAALIADFKRQIADVRAKAPEGAERPKVFLYDSGQDQPFTSGRYAAPEQIISEAGGGNVIHDVADSWTTIKHRRILVLDYVDLVESPRNPAAIARLGAYLRTAVG